MIGAPPGAAPAASMHPHEGPPRNRDAEEQARQRSLTKVLLLLVAALVVAIGVKLLW